MWLSGVLGMSGWGWLVELNFLDCGLGGFESCFFGDFESFARLLELLRFLI